jgi:hypothetical protein
MIAPKPLAAMALLVAVSGCADTGVVRETGPNSYFLSENYSRGLFESARDRGVSRAGEYCFKTDRRAIVEYVLQGPTNEHGAGSAAVTFRCLYRGDPELQPAKPATPQAPR